MATMKRGQWEIEGRDGFYETEVTLASGEVVGPAFIIEVSGSAEVEEIAETLTRSWGQRKRERKPEAVVKPPDQPEPTPVPRPPSAKVV